MLLFRQVIASLMTYAERENPCFQPDCIIKLLITTLLSSDFHSGNLSAFHSQMKNLANIFFD